MQSSINRNSGIAALLLIGSGYLSYSFFKSNAAHGMPSSIHFTSQKAAFFNEEGNPHPALLQLFKLTQIPCVRPYDLDSLVENTQKKWFQGGKERWLLEGGQISATLYNDMMGLLTQLGLIKAMHAQFRNNAYDYVLVHGALASGMESRLKFLKKEYQAGMRFENIVLLSGDRALIGGKEDKFVEQGLKTESEVFEFLWKVHRVDTALAEKLYTIITAPLKRMLNAHGEAIIRRPGMEDNISLWLDTARPQPGAKILAISNQPYVTYQHAILERCLQAYCIQNHLDRSDFYVETIGEGVDENAIQQHDRYIAMHLDNLARCFFEMKQLRDLRCNQHYTPSR